MKGHMVFAYGTLRRGDCRYGLDSFVNMVHEEAYLEGFHLVHLGGFPGLRPGKGRVRGEVHLYSTFDELDAIEGFHEESPEGSLFLRQKVLVEVPPLGETLQASTYLFNADDARRYRVIESGDWFEEHPPSR